MIHITEHIIQGSHGLPLSFDLRISGDPRNAPVVLFCHGWKGFKDWGPFNTLADYWVGEGHAVLKMNFSHNGIKPENLQEITGIEEFGSNTFSTQLEDLGLVLDWLSTAENFAPGVIDARQIFGIGHSLGGAMLLLKALEDKRLRKVVSWAAPADLHKYAELEQDEPWRSRGYTPVRNQRNGQVYPLQYAFRLDILLNWARFDLVGRLDDLNIPCMLIHGSADQTVPIGDMELLSSRIDQCIALTIEGANHTFGGTFEARGPELPVDLALAAEESIEFLTL